MRTVIVSGGTGGLGSVVTRQLLDSGWRVVAPWLVRDELERVGTHPNLQLVQADLRDEKQLDEAVRAATGDADAPLFGVVNLVGGFTSGPRVHETPVEVLDAQLDLNLRTAFSLNRAALPHLITGGGGSIVCISTAATRSPFPGGAPYIASKAALSALVETMALEYRDDHIRVNALLPVVIDTPGNRAAMPDADTRRWSRPADIAKVVEFLLSDAGSAITGGLIPVTNVG